MAQIDRTLVSVKFDAVGRIHQFLLPEAGFEPPLVNGSDVVVARGQRLAYGHVTHSNPRIDQRHESAAAVYPRVIRRATKQDANHRLKQQYREREAYRLGVMKIRERGLAMKLVRVERQFDDSRLIFFSRLRHVSTSANSFASLPRRFVVVSKCDRSDPEMMLSCLEATGPVVERYVAQRGSSDSSRS